MLCLRGKVHGAKFLGKRASPPRGNNGGYFARAIDTSLSPSHMGSVILSSGARYQSYIFIVWIPHLSLASSLLSLLLAIVSYTSGSYVVVVELSRFFSVLSYHLRGTDFISSSERLSCEKDPRVLKNIAF